MTHPNPGDQPEQTEACLSRGGTADGDARQAVASNDAAPAPADDPDEPREGFHVEHVAVSEAKEGKPWFEWLVLACIGAAFLFAIVHRIGFAVATVAVTSWMTALVRLVCRDRSPWKVRSVTFDCFIGVILGIGLMTLYYSLRFLY